MNSLAPKLTDSHISPGPFQKMKVRYASQIFSATVAAAIKTCIQGGMLSSTAETTSTFINHMDKLFDILNLKKKCGSKNFNQPFKNTPQQQDHLMHMLDVFKTMTIFENKIVDGKIVKKHVTNRVKFLKG